MKEAILAFLVALVIGAGINSFINIAPPPAQPDPAATAKTDDASEAADLHNVLVTSDSAFDNDVLKSDKPVLVDFYSDNCVPCKMMAPVVGKLANKYDGKMKFFRLDVDANSVGQTNYNVASIPTFIIFANGKRGESWTGVVPEGTLVSAIDKAIADSHQ